MGRSNHIAQAAQRDDPAVETAGNLANIAMYLEERKTVLEAWPRYRGNLIDPSSSNAVHVNAAQIGWNGPSATWKERVERATDHCPHCPYPELIRTDREVNRDPTRL